MIESCWIRPLQAWFSKTAPTAKVQISPKHGSVQTGTEPAQRFAGSNETRTKGRFDSNSQVWETGTTSSGTDGSRTGTTGSAFFIIKKSAQSNRLLTDHWTQMVRLNSPRLAQRLAKGQTTSLPLTTAI